MDERIKAGDVDWLSLPELATLVVGPESVEFSPAAELTQAVTNLMHHLSHEERSEAAKRGWDTRRAGQVTG